MLSAAQSAGEKLSIGGVTTFLGLGMTFIVLALLIGCILLLELFLKKLSIYLANKNKSVDAPSVIVVEDTTSTQENLNTLETKKTIDESTMQAISEAIAMFSQLDDKNKKPHKNITIKSIVEE